MAHGDADPFAGDPTSLAAGERPVAEFRPDPQAYWLAHLVMAVILGVGAGLVLLWLRNPYPVVGPVGVVLAIAIRAAMVQPQAMAEVWQLTNRRLIGPGGRIILLPQLLTARPFLGAVQLTSTTGDRQLMRYQADPPAVSFLLMTAAGRKPRHG